MPRPSLRRSLAALLGLLAFAGPAQAAPEAELAREVLVLCKPEDALAVYTSQQFSALGTVLTHLGLVPRFHDVSGGLPPAERLARARGVLVWLNAGQLDEPETWSRWLAERVADRQRVVLFGGVGCLAEGSGNRVVPRTSWAPLVAQLGLDYQGEREEAVGATASLLGTPRFEAGPPAEPGLTWRGRAVPPATALVRLSVQGDPEPADAVVVGPRGAVVMDQELLFETNLLTYTDRWRLDPFDLLGRALDTARLPVPDPTTVNGRRAFFAHVDGDGFSNMAVRRKTVPAAQVLYDELLRHESLPTTISVIAGELSGKPALEALARKIYDLPNVEAGSHTFTHPHDWASGTVDMGSGGIGRDGVVDEDETDPHLLRRIKLDPRHEVDDSLAYIQTLLPRGKRTEIMLWSGRTNPTAACLARCEALGIPNLNGGDASLAPQAPSVANLAPYGRHVEGLLQVHSACANENIFTNLWRGPFDGLRRAIDLFRFTESPRRLSAVNIYYHFYAAERAAGMRSLHECYDWSRTQPLAPIFASKYARIVQGYYSMQLRNSPQGWSFSNAGACRTVRFDGEAREPDLAACENVAGFNRANGSLYVHLAAPAGRIVLATKPARGVHLNEANAPLSRWQLSNRGLKASFEALVPARVVLAGFAPHQAVRLGPGWSGPPRADGDGRLPLSAPRAPGSLEVSW